MTQTFDSLVSQFRAPGLRFEVGRGGLTKIVIKNEICQGEIYLHGAHVTHFQPSGQPPVLWMSEKSLFEEGKPIRGGIPICFPWFGPLASDPNAPGHGYARLNEWELTTAKTESSGEVTVTLETNIDSFHLTYQVCFGKTLALSLTVSLHESSKGEVPFEEALHTYFAVSDILRISVEGLEGVGYIDKVDGAKIKEASGQLIRFTGECDRVYLDSDTDCVLRDTDRSIRVRKANSHATVVWNPWVEKSARMADFGDDEWRHMVCVETANVGKHSITLAPGESHTLTARIEVE